ncbi:MAG: acetylornithine deacetylase [Myxococcales bacterium]|nr:acetylornithine deacetylase [Myxococcales bacterium]
MEAALRHLEALVGCDTRNPPRAIDPGGPLFQYLGEFLFRQGFSVEVSDHGEGCVSLFARRGAPRLLWNFHVDTVPVAGGWTSDPHRLEVRDGRAIGLGACDVKGAAACMLSALERAQGDAALLFTSDEEAGDDRCVRLFLARGLPFEGAVIGEPTGCRAVLAHRGMAAVSGIFHGTGGHASAPRALVDSAIHEAVRWGALALAIAREEEAREVGGLAGIRFNLGILQGGQKSNMIADRADLRFAVRSRPGEDPLTVTARLQACADDGRVTWLPGFVGPPLPAPGQPAATALADQLGLECGPPVDFWSEASLFSAAGLPSLVYGPGGIAQAHAPDEWVALDQLGQAIAAYQRILSAEEQAG